MPPFLPDWGERNRLARSHWRLLAGTAAVQGAGTLASALVVQPYGSACSICGSAGPSPPLPGTVLGLAWHLAHAERRAATHWGVVAVVVVNGLALLTFALTVDLAAFDVGAPF